MTRKGEEMERGQRRGERHKIGKQTDKQADRDGEGSDRYRMRQRDKDRSMQTEKDRGRDIAPKLQQTFQPRHFTS